MCFVKHVYLAGRGPLVATGAVLSEKFISYTIDLIIPNEIFIVET